MPLCYSGGVKTVEHVSKIIQLGIEKVGISSKAIEDMQFIKSASALVGSQSVVGILDIKIFLNPLFLISRIVLYRLAAASFKLPFLLKLK